LRALRLDGNRAKRKRLRLARFPSKRSARNASDCVWIETGLESTAATVARTASLIGCSQTP